jgi:hypothetical protein
MCPLCNQVCERTGHGGEPCRDCPEALETSSFFRTVRIAADRLKASTLYWRCLDTKTCPDDRGIVVVQGRHMLSEPALVEVSPVISWLEEENAECLRQMLMARRECNPNPGEPDAEFLERSSLASNGKLLRDCEHAADSEDRMAKNATCRIYTNDKSKEISTSAAMGYLFRTLADNGIILPKPPTPPSPGLPLGGSASSSTETGPPAKVGAAPSTRAAPGEAVAKAAPAMAAAEVDISRRPTRCGTRLTPRVEGWVKPDGWYAVYPTACQELARTLRSFVYYVDEKIKSVELLSYYGDCDGKPIDRYHIRAVGYAMSRILRHCASLRSTTWLRFAGRLDFCHGDRRVVVRHTCPDLLRGRHG